MTSHEQEERGQTLMGCTMLIPEESSIPTEQEQGAEPGATLGKVLTCPVQRTVFLSLRWCCPDQRTPSAAPWLSLSQSSNLQPAPAFQLHFPLTGEAGEAHSGNLLRVLHQTMAPSTCPYLI